MLQRNPRDLPVNHACPTIPPLLASQSFAHLGSPSEDAVQEFLGADRTFRHPRFQRIGHAAIRQGRTRSFTPSGIFSPTLLWTVNTTPCRRTTLSAICRLFPHWESSPQAKRPTRAGALCPGLGGRESSSQPTSGFVLRHPLPQSADVLLLSRLRFLYPVGANLSKLRVCREAP